MTFICGRANWHIMFVADPDWVNKYLTYNQAVAKVPGIVVFVLSVQHIKDALKFAFQHNIEVRMHSSGKWCQRILNVDVSVAYFL